MGTLSPLYKYILSLPSILSEPPLTCLLPPISLYSLISYISQFTPETLNLKPTYNLTVTEILTITLDFRLNQISLATYTPV